MVQWYSTDFIKVFFSFKMSMGFHGTQVSHFIYAHMEVWPFYARLHGTHDMQISYIKLIYLLSKYSFYCANFYKNHNHSINFCGHFLYQILAQSAQKCRQKWVKFCHALKWSNAFSAPNFTNSQLLNSTIWVLPHWMFPINQEIWNVFVAMHLCLTEQITTKLMLVG